MASLTRTRTFSSSAYPDLAPLTRVQANDIPNVPLPPSRSPSLSSFASASSWSSTFSYAHQGNDEHLDFHASDAIARNVRQTMLRAGDGVRPVRPLMRAGAIRLRRANIDIDGVPLPRNEAPWYTISAEAAARNRARMIQANERLAQWREVRHWRGRCCGGVRRAYTENREVDDSEEGMSTATTAVGRASPLRWSSSVSSVWGSASSSDSDSDSDDVRSSSTLGNGDDDEDEDEEWETDSGANDSESGSESGYASETASEEGAEAQEAPPRPVSPPVPCTEAEGRRRVRRTLLWEGPHDEIVRLVPEHGRIVDLVWWPDSYPRELLEDLYDSYL